MTQDFQDEFKKKYNMGKKNLRMFESKEKVQPVYSAISKVSGGNQNPRNEGKETCAKVLKKIYITFSYINQMLGVQCGLPLREK